MSDTTIIVNTCDAYEDTWELFFCAFKEHWPECKFRIILNTENKKLRLDGFNVTTHNYSPSSPKNLWGERLRQTLNSCESEYVIMLYDDFILEDHVNLKAIKDCTKFLNDNPDVSVFYFTNISANTNIQDHRFPGFDRIPQRGDYKLNSAPAIWRKNKLLKYTKQNDTPWAWEFFGSYRTYRKKDSFYCTIKECKPIYPYNNLMGGAIYRGKWVGNVVLHLAKKYNLKIDINERGLAENSIGGNKRSLAWKLSFLLTGFQMIHVGVFVYIYRYFRKKITNEINR